MDSLKWFNSLLRKVQVYQVIEMTPNTVTARETPGTNYLWAHTSHLHVLRGPAHCAGAKVPFVSVGPNSILLAQETREKPRRGMLKEMF